uniref:EB1 C-terminal domain-containing protein n=1 Tax=Strongyloides papillosus TaxID=174720 RepID=A0A0N5BJP6_STREA
MTYVLCSLVEVETKVRVNENHLHNGFLKPSIAEQEVKRQVEIKKVKRQYALLILQERDMYLQNNRLSEEALKEIADDIDLDVNFCKDMVLQQKIEGWEVC